MGKIILNRVAGFYVESLKADKDYENGQLVGKGKLVEGENRLYTVDTNAANADNHYLVSTPEVDPTKKYDGLDFTNKKDSVMRAHQLEVGDTFTVEQRLHEANIEVGDKVTVKAGKFAKGNGEGGAYVLDMKTTIGADRRPAYLIRKVK